MVIAEPRPKPPNNTCVQCLETIVPGEHTCSKNPTGRHRRWGGDNTGLRKETQDGTDD